MKKKSAVWLVLSLAIIFTLVHFGSEWVAAVNDAETHGVPFVFQDFFVEWVRATFENLQSEMWQLALQFALLAGVFRMFGITAYEDDNEEIKQKLNDIERKMNNDVSNMPERRVSGDVRLP